MSSRNQRIAPKSLPSLPPSVLAPESDMKAFWQRLRIFFRSGQKAIDDQQEGTMPYPVLLAPYQDMSQIRHDYPLWVAPPGNPTNNSSFCPLTECLQNAITTLKSASQDDKILQDNLFRFEDLVRKQVTSENCLCSFREMLGHAAQTMQQQLALTGSEGESLSVTLTQFLEHLPQEGSLLPFTFETPFYLFSLLLQSNRKEKEEAFFQETLRLREKLQELLLVEQAKSKEARSPNQLNSALGLGTTFVDTTILSNVLPETSSEPLPIARLKRIKEALLQQETLESTLTQYDALIFIPDSWESEFSGKWESIFSSSKLIPVPQKDRGQAVLQTFEDHMEGVAQLFAAIRIARLEIDDAYQPDIHDAFFEHFDWRAFTEEEINLVPPVIWIEKEGVLWESELSRLSQILVSESPIKIIVINSGSSQKTSLVENDFLTVPQELGHLAISHRKAFVFQGTASHSQHLLKGLREGLQTPVPALLHLLSPKVNPPQEPYLWASAAVESRDFVLFNYNPYKEGPWGSRFEIGNNPQHNADWSMETLTFLDTDNKESNLTLAFTFADFAALEPTYRNHFFVIPPNYWTEDLVALDEYLQLSKEDSYHKVPFIWMINSDNHLQKVVVSYALTRFCREKLEYWRVIQDLGGTHNYHAEMAFKQAREEALAEAAQQIETLQETHQQEVNRVQQETAREAMERLTNFLLEFDSLPSQPVSQGTAPTSPLVEPPNSELPNTKTELQTSMATPEIEEAEEVEEELSLGEPWIDSFRCTTCNECTELNSVMFHYNADKQAYIRDPHAGTFKELVTAAEKCPAKCIHPGQPLNADEPDLEALIQRAVPFN